MRTFTFKGGVRPPQNKTTLDCQITPMPAPPQLIYPLTGYFGAECEPMVEMGENVRAGQMIAKENGELSVPVHASVSGRVSAVEPRLHPSGEMVNSIVIENDGQDNKCVSAVPERSFRDMPSEEIAGIVKEAGIVGVDGFPTHIKLSPLQDKYIDCVIINGAECEPYLTADHRVMAEKAKAVLYGMQTVLWSFRLREGYIGIEADKHEAIKVMTEAAQSSPSIKITVVPLKSKYPQGSERQLIRTITGQEVPKGKLPADMGVIVHNVETCRAIADVMKTGMPLTEQVITVAGDCVRKRGNYLIKIGTPVKDVLSFCNSKIPAKVIMGGPMTGAAIPSLEVPVIKSAGGILAFSKRLSRTGKTYPCTRCGKCAVVCPMRLIPCELAGEAQAENIDQLTALDIENCTECGACSYVCPSNRHPLKYIRLAR